MSRIGKNPINIPESVTVSNDNGSVKVKGPKGELFHNVHPNMNIEIEKNEVIVKRPNDTKQNKALHGMTRALIQNMVTGVTEEYKITLDIIGVGFRAELKGKNLLMHIGYSHPIFFMPPEEIKIETPTQTQVVVTGIDKQLVGMVASKIRSFRKPEPYKGKGIKYSDEHIVRKAGKTAG